MRKMGDMEQRVRAKHTQIEGMCMVRTDGRAIGTLRASGDPDQQTLVSEYEIFRGDLSRIIHDMSVETGNVEYVFGEQIASMSHSTLGEGQDSGPITVEFANGKLPKAQYDLVVACDGSASRTRAMGLGCAARDYVHSTNGWAAYFSIPKEMMDYGKNIAHGYSAPGSRALFVGADPTGGSRAVMMCFNPSTVQPFREALKGGDANLKRFLAKLYSGTGYMSEDVIEGLMNTKDLYASEIVQVKSPALSKGRFVMVGDAGYAPGLNGTGTTLAMTGGYILAGEIARHRGDLSAALRGYEVQMRPLITDMQQTPRFLTAIMAPQSAWALAVRNAAFTVIANVASWVAWTGIFAYAQGLFASAFASGEKYKLPEYEWER